LALVKEADLREIAITSTIRLRSSLLRDHAEPALRLAALDALRADTTTARSLIPQILSRFEDPEIEVRMAAIAVAGSLGEPMAEHLGRLEDMLCSEEPSIRKAALEAVGSLRSVANELAIHVSDSIDDEDETVRQAAVEAFAEFPEVLRDDVARLAGHASDPFPDIRVAVIHSLRRVAPTDPLTHSCLVSGLLDAERKVQDAAKVELSSLLHSCELVDPHLAVLIGFFGEERGSPLSGNEQILMQLASRGEAAWRRVAIRALGRGAPARPEVVRRMLGWLRDDDPGIREESARALGRMGSPAEQAVDGLVDVVSDPEIGPAVAAAESLVLIKPSDFPDLGSAYARRRTG
jgi:HEAT repeat protein